jgi:hypothetical protein
LTLPTEKTKRKTDLQGLSILIYGQSKIGKSTFCSNADKALFLATEPGLNSLDVYQMDIESWDDLLKACGDIAKGDHDYKTIIIDTVDNAYKMCSEYICNKFKVEHEADLSYGKGFSLVRNELHRVLTKLAFMPYGLIMVSHSQEINIETRTGSRTKTVPTMPEKPREIVTGLVDMILYCDIEVTQDKDNNPIFNRVIRTKPSLNYDAGDRTGRLPEMLPLDYKAFLSTFNKKGAK